MATDRFAEAEFLKYVNKVNLVIFIPGFRTAPARSVQIWLWSRELSEQSRWTVLTFDLLDSGSFYVVNCLFMQK